MDLHFLGGATTVTGSRFLLTTSRAKVLVDCGMFQGSPNEAVRNRIPIGFEAGELDAILLTHAHLDHCGLLPIAVREGFAGPIHATPGTIELATLVLLDSGRLNEEFAKRGARWERRHPDDAAAEDKVAEANYRAAVEQAHRGDAGVGEATAVETAQESASSAPPAAAAPAASATPAVDPEADLHPRNGNLCIRGE